MGVNGLYGISGSGLDIESMVKAGMLSRQNKYDKMYKEATKQEWVKEAYSGVYSMLTDYKNSLTKFKLSSSMAAMKAESNNSAVTCTATGDAVAMSHNVKVNSVASNAYLMSGGAISRATADPTRQTSNQLIDSMFKAFVDNGDGTYDFVKTDGTTLRINDLSETAMKFEIADGETIVEMSYSYQDLVDGKTFSSFATDIKNLGLNITASYDSANDTFMMYNSKSGSKNKIMFTLQGGQAAENAAQLLNSLNLEQSRDGELSPLDAPFSANSSLVAGKGTDASVTIDGREYTNLESNYLQVGGVNYTFHDTMRAGDTARITVSQDTDAIIANVQEFVDGYNELLEELNKLVGEETFNKYQPLTDDEKNEMSESQITAWEKKAKSGLLNNSTILRNVISSMRESIYTRVDSVDSKYNSASAIGITSINNEGKLKLDTDKLKQALEEDPDCVYKIFASDDEEWDNLTDEQKRSGTYDYVRKSSFAGTGIANRLYFTAMNNGIKSIQDYAGSSSAIDDQTTLGKSITNLKSRMTAFKTQMDKYRDRLYSKYDNLEVLIQRLSVQLSTVTSYGQQ